MRSNVRNEDGQVLVMVALTMLGLLSVVGLVSDGGLVFSQRRDLQNAADAAAAAGAMQIDEAAYRSAGTVILDEGAARETAAAYLELEDGITYAVAAHAEGVEVVVWRRASTGFLRVIGIDGVEISARAVAEPRYGIEEANR